MMLPSIAANRGLTVCRRAPGYSHGMRALPLIPALLLTSACWTSGPGPVDPTRYPWDQPARPSASYCVMSLETPAATGITPGGQDGMALTCKEPAAH